MINFSQVDLRNIKNASKITSQVLLTEMQTKTDAEVFQTRCKYLARLSHLLNPQPPDHQSHTLPSDLSHYLVACVNHQGLYKVMLY